MRNFLKLKTRVVILTSAFISIFDGVGYAEDFHKTFPAVCYLATLNGTNGFTINGNGRFGFGYSVSGAGDVNGDGIDDIIIGAGDRIDYVIFGSNKSWSSVMDISHLDGSNGFAIGGDEIGYFVGGAGDVNGDGIDDILIQEPRTSKTLENPVIKSYIIFGSKKVWPPRFNLRDVNGTNGFIIQSQESNSGKVRGSLSRAGDVNGDGIADIVMGDEEANDNAGQSYVVFGSNMTRPAVINVVNLSGSNGFAINGINSGDHSGHSVSGAGDVNGDGIDDILIGTYHGNNNIYIVFGSNNSWLAQINLTSLNGSNGFAIKGFSRDGFSLSEAGDVNGDGIDDILIGDASSSYSFVIFGSKKPWPPSIDRSNLNGTNGFFIEGERFDASGCSVSGAGDINRDGIDDILIGAYRANNKAGQSYIIFGSNKTWSRAIYLPSLDGSNGFAINGIHPDDNSGFSVSGAGDVNGDGLDDIIIGAYHANDNRGQSYVMFHCPGEAPPTPAPASNTPLILGLTLGIGGGILLTGVGSYYGYQHCQHSGYVSVE